MGRKKNRSQINTKVISEKSNTAVSPMVLHSYSISSQDSANANLRRLEDMFPESDEDLNFDYMKPGESGCYSDTAEKKDNIQRAEYVNSEKFSNGAKPKGQFHYSQNVKYDEIPFVKSTRQEYNVTKSIKKDKYITDSFLRSFYKWKNERMNTLSKLQKLYSDVHDDQMAFNSVRYTCKNVSYHSRSVKSLELSDTADFFTSLTALLSDTVNGITSAAQVYNVDNYKNTFEEIMEHDKKITEPLYAARSLYVAEYKDVEEITRKYHSDTFSSTVEKISSVLEVDKFLMALECQKGSGVQNVSNTVSQFIDHSCKPEICNEVFDSAQNYIENNPAALDAVKSAGKAVYGVMDTWGSDKGNKKSIVATAIKRKTNNYLMQDDKLELDKLEVTMQKGRPQTYLEEKIQNAIHALQKEMDEIILLASNMNTSCMSSTSHNFYKR